jgi:hypothetical protein
LFKEDEPGKVLLNRQMVFKLNNGNKAVITYLNGFFEPYSNNEEVPAVTADVVTGLADEPGGKKWWHIF